MHRRDISTALFAVGAASSLIAHPSEAQTCPTSYFAITNLEKKTGVPIVCTAYPPGDVRRYGADPTGTTDSTAAINNAIVANAIIPSAQVSLQNSSGGGTVTFVAGIYKVTSPLLAEKLSGLTIIAPSGVNGVGGAVINAVHTGKAILSLVGSNSVTIGGLTLSGNATTKPQTGLLLGRSSAASAGNHQFNGLCVIGSFSIAAVYNVASEINQWFGCSIIPNASPLAAVYMSQTDNSGIGGLTGSSMESNSFFGGTIYNTDSTAGSTSVFIDGGGATGHIHFYNTFLAKNGGDSWVYIRLGASDDQAPRFPIGFHDCEGESGTSSPNYGVHIHNAVGIAPLNLCGLTLYNCRWQFPTIYNIFCDGSSGGTVQLIGANIFTPYNVGANGVPSVFQQCTQCTLNLLFESAITIANGLGNFITWNQRAPTITNNAATNVLFNNSGTMTLPQIGINGNAPPAQVSGFGTPTGAAIVTNFSGESATLIECSEMIARIVTDLKAFGLYRS